MTIYRKDGNTWSEIFNGKAYVDVAGVWKPIVKIYVDNGSEWLDTGYLGIPNAPTIALATGWQTTYDQVSFTITPPTTGPEPETYTAYLYAENGTTLLDSNTGTSLTRSFAVSNSPLGGPAPKYIISVKSNLGSVQSVSSNLLKVQMGVAPYPYFNYPSTITGSFRPTVTAVTSTTLYSSSTYSSSKMVDNNANTLWISGSRFQSGDYRTPSNSWEGVNLGFPTTGGFDANSKLVSITFTTVKLHKIYIGVQNQDDTWKINELNRGTPVTSTTTYTPTNLKMDTDTNDYPNSNYVPRLVHNYCLLAPTAQDVNIFWNSLSTYKYTTTVNVSNFLLNQSTYESALKIGDIKSLNLAIGSFFSGLNVYSGAYAAGLDPLPASNAPYGTYHAGIYEISINYTNRETLINPGTTNQIWS